MSSPDSKQPTSSSNSDKNTLVSVLSLLERYEAAHTKANDVWKSALWNIYKSRHLRKRHNLGYSSETYCSASDIREDLTARWTLREEKSNNNTTIHRWTSVQDGVAMPSHGTSTKDATDPDEALVTVATSTSTDEGNEPSLVAEQEISEGLRQRKGVDNKNSSDSTSKWTVEHEDEAQEKSAPINPPIDPLELLAGAFPPRELKQAQTHAKKALQLYIDAANLILEIQQRQARKPTQTR